MVLPEYDRDALWRVLADLQAAHMVGRGYRYFCNASDAPPELIAYRNDPASGWMPTSRNGKPPKDDGRNLLSKGGRGRAVNRDGLVVSHEYVGKEASPPPFRPFGRKVAGLVVSHEFIGQL